MGPDEFERLKQLADTGDLDSMFKLAKLYRSGKSFRSGFTIPRDSETARELLRTAAARGYGPAQRLLRDFDKEPIPRTIFGYVGRLIERIESFLVFIFTGVGWILGLLLVAGVIWLVFLGVAALPVSIAIIVGALIITAAVRR